jgi:hypothetical protein
MLGQNLNQVLVISFLLGTINSFVTRLTKYVHQFVTAERWIEHN